MPKEPPDTSTPGGRLRFWREYRFLTQPGLATRSGVAPTVLSRYENNSRAPSPANWQKLADALEIPREALVHGGDWKEVLKQSITADFQSAERLRSHPVIYSFLADELKRTEPLYDYPRQMMVRDLHGVRVPIPVSVLAMNLPITLGHLNLTSQRKVECDSDAYVTKRELVSKEFYNGRTYTMQDIEIGPRSCTISGGITEYVTAVATHNALEHELLWSAHELHREGELTIAKLKKRLPRREAFLGQGRSEKRRFSTLGISTAIIYNAGTEYRVLVRKRSGDTAVHPNLFHTIPACGFGPELDPRGEWDVLYCVIREYCEELFRKDIDRARIDPRYIYEEWPPARALLKALGAKQVETPTQHSSPNFIRLV